MINLVSFPCLPLPEILVVTLMAVAGPKPLTVLALI